MNSTNLVPKSQRPFNVASACIGFLMFIFGMWLLLRPIASPSVDYRLVDVIICCGIGLLLYAIGDEAKIVGKNYNLTGASGITVILTYMFIYFNIGKPEVHETHGKLEISAADVSNSTEILSSSSPDKPVRFLIFHREGILVGVARQENPFSYIIDFSMSDANLLGLDSTDCPLLVIELKNGKNRRKSFLSKEVMSRDYRYFFDMIFKIDISEEKDRLSSRTGANVSSVSDCGTPKGRSIADVTASPTRIAIYRDRQRFLIVFR